MIDKSLLTKIPEWDNGKTIDSDYKFEDYWEDLLPKIKLMPKLDTTIKHYSQYAKDRYWTGCTIMSAINAFATINNYDFSEEQISLIYDFAETRWFKPGQWWSRSEGWMTVMKRWNTKFPNDKALLFTIALFSEEFNEVISKLWTVGISLNVDSKYWADVRDNLVLDWYEFVLSGGHATNIMKLENNVCIDSIPQDVTHDRYTPMVYEFWGDQRVEILRDQHNLRNDCHVVIMERWLKEKDPKEIERLTKFKALLDEAIMLNSDIWFLTNNEAEKKERQRQNDYNRGKLAVVNALLG